VEKSKRSAVVGLVLALLLLLPLSAQTTPEVLPVPLEETVVVETDTLPTVFDRANPFIPMGTQWGSGWHQVANEWDWYINYATGEIIPWRITGWEYQDNYKVLIIRVREGVEWNDGHPYTARDIVFTLNLLKENPDLFSAWIAVEWVERAEIKDNLTAVIYLKKPNPRFHHFFRMWGGLTIVAEHVWKGKDPRTFANWPPVETGPYKLYKVYPDLRMFVWVKNENYWAKKLGLLDPAPKYVVYRYAPPPDIDLADFVKGVATAPLPHIFSWDMIKAAKALTEPGEVVLAPFLDPCPLGISAFNVEKYPLNITEFRWAISYLLDREKLAKTYPMAEKTEPCYIPWALPAWEAFKKYKPMTERALKRIEEEFGFKVEYNPKKAAEILDKLGFIDRNGDGIRETPDGKPIRLEIVSRPPTVLQEYYIAVELTEALKKVGIDATLKAVDPAMWHELAALGQFDIAVGSLCTPAWLTGDLVDMFNVVHSKFYAPTGERAAGGIHGANPRYRNPELDAIIDELWTLDPESRRAQELYEKGLYIWFKDLFAIPAVEKMFVQVFSAKYWTVWPTETDMYMVPYQWWPSFIFVLGRIRPARPRVIEYVSVWANKDIPEFTGTDGKKYGPFKAGEYFRVPKEDADRLIKEGLASYKAPLPGELVALIEDVSKLREQLTQAVSKMDELSEKIDSLTGLVYAILGLALITLLVSVVALVRKRGERKKEKEE